MQFLILGSLHVLCHQTDQYFLHASQKEAGQCWEVGAGSFHAGSLTTGRVPMSPKTPARDTLSAPLLSASRPFQTIDPSSVRPLSYPWQAAQRNIHSQAPLHPEHALLNSMDRTQTSAYLWNMWLSNWVSKAEFYFHLNFNSLVPFVHLSRLKWHPFCSSLCNQLTNTACDAPRLNLVLSELWSLSSWTFPFVHWTIWTPHFILIFNVQFPFWNVEDLKVFRNTRLFLPLHPANSVSFHF